MENGSGPPSGPPGRGGFRGRGGNIRVYIYIYIIYILYIYEMVEKKILWYLMLCICSDSIVYRSTGQRFRWTRTVSVKIYWKIVFWHKMMCVFFVCVCLFWQRSRWNGKSRRRPHGRTSIQWASDAWRPWRHDERRARPTRYGIRVCVYQYSSFYLKNCAIVCNRRARWLSICDDTYRIHFLYFFKPIKKAEAVHHVEACEDRHDHITISIIIIIHHHHHHLSHHQPNSNSKKKCHRRQHQHRNNSHLTMHQTILINRELIFVF